MTLISISLSLVFPMTVWWCSWQDHKCLARRNCFSHVYISHGSTPVFWACDKCALSWMTIIKALHHAVLQSTVWTTRFISSKHVEKRGVIIWVGLIWEDFQEEVWLEEAVPARWGWESWPKPVKFWEAKARFLSFLTQPFPHPSIE